jgi:hypothetical protein
MQVFHVADGSAYPVYSLNESKKELVIENVVIDLEKETGDDQNIINITRKSNGECVIGLEGKNGYVADIEIPPRQYRFEETGEGEDKKTEKISLPLDLNTVVLKLWPHGTEETVNAEEA